MMKKENEVFKKLESLYKTHHEIVRNLIESLSGSWKILKVF